MDTARVPHGDATDAQLIRAAAHGDEVAFGRLFERHAKTLRLWLYAQAGDMAVSEDLLAETFAQALRSAWRFHGGDEDGGAAWLYGIASNLLRRYYRRGRIATAALDRLGVATITADAGGIDESPGRIDATRLTPQLRSAFNELTPEQQQAIGYRVLSELSYEEIARELQCTPSTARQRVSRGLRALRTNIESAQKGASNG